MAVRQKCTLIVIDEPSPKRAVWLKCLGCGVTVADLTDKQGLCWAAGFPAGGN